MSNDCQNEQCDVAPQVAHQVEQNVDAQKQAQEKFEERLKLFTNELSTRCDEEDVKVAIAIVLDPANDNGALIYYRGHKYDVSKALASVLRSFKSQMANELS